MLTLDTRNIPIKASFNKIKRYYSSKPSAGNNNCSESTGTNDNNVDIDNTNDEQVSRILERFMPAVIGGPSDNAVPADEFLTRILDPKEERAKQPDFIDGKKVEVDGLMKREIWSRCNKKDIKYYWAADLY